MTSQSNAVRTPFSETVPIKEKLSYAFTNTGQTMIYGLFNMLMLFMTDYLVIPSAVAGLIISIARIYDGLIDPYIGTIVDKTKSKWGKCRPYMLFTPIPVAIVAMVLFAPTGLSRAAAIPYAIIFYFLFTTVYSINDIPYWSMSAVISSNPKERVNIVTMTRIIGGCGSAITIGLFWTVKRLFGDYAGTGDHMSFFLAVVCFSVIGAAVMMQGFFNTKERAVCREKKESIINNFKYVFKCRPLVLNIIGGALYSVVVIGTSALTTYFVKWNMKELFPSTNSDKIMSIFTPVIGILPAIASVLGILLVPLLIKKFEKRTLLVGVCAIGVVGNVISYFAGYSNLYVFLILRFVSFLPVGVWSGVTTLMIGDSVDFIEHKYGRRLEGTCFSILTFMGNFQNSISIAIVGLILTFVGYNGNLDPNLQQQSPLTLQGIFVMVTLVAALGYLLSLIPFLFYNFTDKQHKEISEQNRLRRAEQNMENEDGEDGCAPTDTPDISE